ncbi:MAG: helix-turn-helix domain-containing protein [Gammaproteobacteria bacterium]|nr:MAG: helix-turn-helix domain-containing protein [Gammaproteobacteria bacterium]
MNLDQYLTAHEKPISFSKRIGVPTPSLSNWRRGKRPIPIKWMIIIEKETGGLVSRKELCDRWHEIWPELATQEQTESETAA